jgi:flagellar protein FliO/FliZ
VSSGRPLPIGRLALGVLALAYLGCSPAAAFAAPFKRDETPLPADVSGTGGAKVTAHVASGASGAAVHMLLGLAIVVALIFGLYKLLKRSSNKNDKTAPDDGWMGVLSTTPLAPSRSLHLVRVGEELILLGSSDGSVTPIRVYTADEALALGVDPRTARALPPSRGARSVAGVGAALLEGLKRMTAR